MCQCLASTHISLQWHHISVMASQITSNSTVYSATCWSQQQRLIKLRITCPWWRDSNDHRGSPHKGPAMRKAHDDVIMLLNDGNMWAEINIIWWCRQMEAFPALLALWIPLKKASDTELWCFLWSAWTNGWANNGDACDLRRHRAHYDVTVMQFTCPGGPKIPLSSGARVIIIFCWMVSAVIAGTYCANLTSHLAVHKQNSPFTTLRGALEHDVPFYTSAYGFTRTMFSVSATRPTGASFTINTLRPSQDGRHCVQIMAWCRPGDEPLFEPMTVSLLTQICVTWPQWVKRDWLDQHRSWAIDKWLHPR